ncbi:uncharacterized protein LOC133916116 [Phragmites australis]|uniref:uncharacterized protein LOC133916116 n=1 Tax=Phragmites australis TaxID=29695 RepID=UPI002D7A05C5|nr:uncharacterized protein LOC133916116 [Phragmites australis]
MCTEAKMEPLDLEDNGDHQPSSEAFLASDVIYDDSPVCTCIGSEHQAEIPNLATEDERRELMTSSLNDSTLHGYGYPIVVGLALPIMWASPSEVNKKEEELEMQKNSEIEARASSRDEESQVTSICPTSNNTSKCDPTYQDPHTVVPVVQVESDSNQAHDEKLASCPPQEGVNFTNNPMMQQSETRQLNPLPYSPIALWSDLEAELFLLGLYIFGKKLNLLSRFLGTKSVGDVLSYYYGKFYQRDAYKRWSDCRKAKTKRSILGERIFQGSRQQELISHLKSKIPKEAHDSLIEVFKSFSHSQTSLEEFVFALKSTVGTEAFVEAVGIGKGKRDLTGFVMDPSKPNQALSVHLDLPTGKDCSSLASEDIIKFLTGDFRRSKTRSNDIFWEAVWPRLLAKGWHSEQPKDVSTTKNCLVFLVPGIKKFSRSKLTKGTHYFDSVSDVLRKVAADPVLLELEADGIDNGLIAEKNGCMTDMKLNQDSPLDGYQELPKFTIIDTSLVEGEEPFKVRELRSLPADANITFGLTHHSSNMVSESSSEEQDASDRLSDDLGNCGRVTADVKDIEMVSVDSLQNMVTANGHSSNGNDDKIDLTSIYGLKTKTERHKYLSPVSKRRRLTSCSNEQTSRRRLASCSNEQTSRHGFSFSKGGGLEKEKSKPLSTSSKPTAVDVGDTSHTKTIAGCSTKGKPSEQKMDALDSLTNDGPNEKMSMANLIEDKSFECKVDAVAEVHSKNTVDETKFAKESAQVSGLINSNKLETPHNDKAGGSICFTSSENHGGMKAEEAPSISNSNMACDPSEATGRPVSQQPEAALQANPRRHGTRNRPPTAKALEAVAFGLLGSGKRKGDPKNTVTNGPSQWARKSTEHLVSMAASGDAEKSSMNAKSQR